MLNNIESEETMSKKALGPVEKIVAIVAVAIIETILAVVTMVVYGILAVFGAIVETCEESMDLARLIKEDVKGIYNA